MKNNLVVLLAFLLTILFTSCSVEEKPLPVIQWYETEVELTFEDGSVDVIIINISTHNKEVDEDELYTQMSVDEGDFKYWRHNRDRSDDDWIIATRVARASFVQRFKILSYKLTKQKKQ